MGQCLNNIVWEIQHLNWFAIALTEVGLVMITVIRISKMIFNCSVESRQTNVFLQYFSPSSYKAQRLNNVMVAIGLKDWSFFIPL